MQTAYLIDLGALIFPGENEFDAYAIVYDRKYGYYDQNQWYSLDRDEAIREAREWIDEGNDRAYAIVSETWLADDVTQQDIDDGDVEVNEHYLTEDVIFARAVIDGKIEDLF